MISRNVPEAEKKLMILFTLARVGPCTAEQLLQFMAEYGLMDYFTLQLTLYDLEALNQAERRVHPYGELFGVTTVGAYTVEQFERRIPASFRDTVNLQADRWRERFYLEQQATAEVVTVPGGKAVHLLLLQDDRLLLEVRMPVPGGDKATLYLQRRWREAACDAYQLALHLLSADCPDEAPPMPDDTAAEQRGEGDVLLHLNCGTGDMALAVEDMKTAAWCVHRWAQIGQEVLGAVLELLHLSLQQEE